MDDAIKILISRLRHDISKDATFYDKKVAIMIADAKKKMTGGQVSGINLN